VALISLKDTIPSSGGSPSTAGVERGSLGDVTQSVWALLLEDLPSFECDPRIGSFRAWLFVRVRNASVNQVREADRRREQCVGVDFERYEGSEVNPAQAFERHWNEIVLQDALNLLEGSVSTFDYKLFVLHRLHEMPISELAEDTGLCESTIRSKLHRTWKTMSSIFEHRGYRDLLFQCD